MTARSHTRTRRRYWHRNRRRLRELEQRAKRPQREDPREDWLPPPEGFADWLADQRRKHAPPTKETPTMDDATLRAAAGQPPPAPEPEIPDPDEVLRAAVARTDRRTRKVTTGDTTPRPATDLHWELHKAGAYITTDNEIVVEGR